MIKIHLSRLMGEQRINQIELATKADIRPATINEYYHELVERVNLDYLSRICAALNCDISDLLEYIPDDPDQPRIKRRPRPRKKPKDDTIAQEQ